ncbi:GumC family protein [Myxacorys almedinensis]|uniref:non-specific protein-tyrosine kinase n=1 Tax=Myxacorys almedinensis A TaxID=2690445 RepID=A0A8J7Z0E5_9CYAN|nr:polysaccharide biosynthesis tyrosine autokinase [Myxacorys almedinensis]NDJ15871.1 polysaccharide biosynthesis tyrosine autokinase [Myxacorys almedinensis A]
MNNQSNSGNSTHTIVERNGKSPLVLDYATRPHVSQSEEDWQSPQVLDIARRRGLLIAGTAMTVTLLTGVITLRQTDSYEGAFQILVEPVTAESEQGLDPLSSEPKPSSNTGLDYATQIQVLGSPKTMKPIVEQIQKRYPEIGYGSLMDQLSISRPEDTKLIAVKYKDEDPDRVKFVLDQLAAGYLTYSQQERQSNLRQGITFVDDQIESTRKRVDTLQRQIQTFRQRNNLIGTEALASQVASQIQGLEQQRLEARREIAETQKQYNNLQDPSGAIAALAADPAYQKVLDKMREIDSKAATESTRFQASEPEMAVLQEQRNSLIPVLRQEARRVLGDKMASVGTDLSVLETRQQVLGNAQRYWEQEVQRLPVVSRIYSDLERELNVATDSLGRFLATRENLQVQAAQKEVPWQLIAPPATPQMPEDTKQRNLVLGAIAGLLLGVGAATIAERVDDTIRTNDELRKHVRLPILGSIPLYEALQRPHFLQRGIPQRADLRSDTFRYSGFSESFGSLYSTLRMLKADQPIRSVVISSPSAGDGKSTVATYLAQAAAAMGHRVLLVDADLRHPQISSLLDLANDRGLVDVLTSNLNPQQAIQRVFNLTAARVTNDPTAIVADDENLYVLTSGQVPPNPARLLSSQKMKRLSEYFHAMFDLVIYDAPPLLNLADSKLLASHTDGMILVTGLGKTSRFELTQVLDRLQTARTPVLGMVANRDPSSFADMTY